MNKTTIGITHGTDGSTTVASGDLVLATIINNIEIDGKEAHDARSICFGSALNQDVRNIAKTFGACCGYQLHKMITDKLDKITFNDLHSVLSLTEYFEDGFMSAVVTAAIASIKEMDDVDEDTKAGAIAAIEEFSESIHD